jgi:hypothetical protein
MNTPRNPPRTIADYLVQLRAALHGADPALVQDALYDAEDHLRSELAENPHSGEAEMLAKIVNSYGAPAEVAAIYVDNEQVVQNALKSPPPPPRRTPWGRYFGIAADPRAYAALVFLLLSLPTGIFYFTWAATGISLSLGLSILIVGLPFIVLFFGSVRAIALVEGRLIEVMLGERMPRRPLYARRDRPWLSRIKEMFTDPRSWSTLLYLILKLPLGIAGFVIVTVGIALSLGLMAAPVACLLVGLGVIDGEIRAGGDLVPPIWLLAPLAFVAGTLLLFATLHVARGLGRLHAVLAKPLLVQRAGPAPTE